MESARSVLVVDDDEALVNLVEQYLSKEGYQVLTAFRGEEALRLFHRREIDLIVLDLMLPGMDGMKVCTKIREESDVPIVMLTAKTEEDDKIKGLDLGADDYVTKPFSPGELLARIRARFRRSYQEGDSERVSFGDLTVNIAQRKAWLGEELLDLTPTEFNLLEALVEQPGRVFSRKQLIRSAFDYGHGSFERTIDVHINNLRSKIESDPSDPQYIKTEYGVGYKFEPEFPDPDIDDKRE